MLSEYGFEAKKVFNVGFDAIKELKNEISDIKLIIFGTTNKSEELPDWCEYYCQPSNLYQIYNSASIFVASSYSEGFGLTVFEAMSCGCAVACTDIGGYSTIAINEITALISPAGDVDSLKYNIRKLIENPTIREYIAFNGNQATFNFSWDKAYQKFKKLIEK